MDILYSKVIVITGGSIGIGFEVAKKCTCEGATVIISARHKENLQDALKKLNKISGRGHLLYQLDISKNKDVRSFALWCSKRFPQIYGLVNCAAIYGPIGKTNKVDMEKFREAININFLGTAYMCHGFIPLMVKSASGKKIVNFLGGGAANPFPNYSAYAASKAAVVRFTENLSVELFEEGFDVNCIAPGFVITQFHRQTIEAGPELATQSFFEATKKQIESGGVPAEKAANLAVFLLSSQSNGITGKFISAPWDPWQKKNFKRDYELTRTLRLCAV